MTGSQLKAARQIFIHDFIMKADNLAPGEGVQIAAQGVRLFGNLQGRALARAFEKRVFEEMGQPVLLGGFVALAGAQEDTQADRTGVLHPFREHDQAVLERCIAQIKFLFYPHISILQT